MLNVLTQKGREAEENSRAAILKLSTPEVRFAWFPQTNFYPIDGFRIEGHEVTGIFEGKSRNASYENGAIIYQRRRYEDYLITANKLDQGIEIAKQMRADFFLFVLLELSNHILVFTIWDEGKQKAISFKRARTKTQAGVNGGEAIRENAYIEIKEAKVVKL